ncbi:MAG: metal-sulfur cluster assembly factor [Candidatus Bathyarchaeia archaeon]
MGKKTTELSKQVRMEVEALIDPETGLSYAQMGLIKGVKEVKKGVVHIDFTPSSPFCPIALKMAYDVKKAASNVEGVKEATVQVHDHMMGDAINKLIKEGPIPE